MKAEKLRPYQLKVVELVRSLIRAGFKNILIVAPTGSGKTKIATYIVSEVEKKGGKAVFVVDRLSLIDQTSMTFYEEGVDHGIIQGDNQNYAPHLPVQIASQQTLTRRKWPEAKVAIIDEAHSRCKTVDDRLAGREIIGLGLTATPFTKGLGKLYDAVVNVITTNELIRQGYLSKYRIYAPSEPDMTGVKIIAGKFEEEECAKRSMKVVGDCVAEYIKLGQGRKFICSAVNVAHVMELQRQFQAAGITCATYTYKDEAEDRADIVREFRKPDSEIRGLITVTAASKGFDVPDIGVVIMARPLAKSLSEHIQFFGRGLRISPGKDECIILDHSGNCRRFWDEWNDFFETGAVELDDGKKKEKPKPKEKAEPSMAKCPKCSSLHKAMPHCPCCGFEYPAKEAVKHEAGTLEEFFSPDGKKVDPNLWPQICTHARKAKPFDDAGAARMAKAIYYKYAKAWPTQSFEKTKPIPVSRELAGKLHRDKIAYQAAIRKQA
jgi:superfamily II DNA or RNA helicase